MKALLSRVSGRIRSGTADSAGATPLRLFLHLPKTAGTSFRKSAEAYLGPGALLYDYGAHQRLTSRALKRGFYRTGDPLDLIEAARHERAALVCGHVPVHRYGGLVGLINCCTIVREPLARVLSHFRHAVRHQGFEGGLMDFARQPGQRNVQSRGLGHLDPALLGIVGLTGHFADTLALVNARWGWRLSPRVENVDDGAGDAVCPEHEQTALAALNEDDQRLYQRAVRVFRNSLDYLGRDPVRELRGALVRHRAGDRVSGWCFEPGSERPAEAELFCNGRPVARVRALAFRPQLASWGMPRSGCAGFDIQGGTIRAGDRLALVDPVTGIVLDECDVEAKA